MEVNFTENEATMRTTPGTNFWCDTGCLGQCSGCRCVSITHRCDAGYHRYAG